MNTWLRKPILIGYYEIEKYYKFFKQKKSSEDRV